jgi:hypothetical protein
MKQETSGATPGIPSLQGGEEVNLLSYSGLAESVPDGSEPSDSKVPLAFVEVNRGIIRSPFAQAGGCRPC